jgi:hypothetical protein
MKKKMTKVERQANAARQKLWREKRKALFRAVHGAPSAAAEAILALLGVDKARKLAKALEQKATKHDREL